MPLSVRVPVTDASGVGEARRVAADIAGRLGFAEARRSDVAIVATELATNVLKHAPEGELVVSPAAFGRLDLLALDRGPGIARIGEVLRDGYSTAGTPGTGLGAVIRLANAFDVYSAERRGSVVYAQLAERRDVPPPGAFDIGAVQLPHPDEVQSGDDWAALPGETQLRLLVIDGLGHGPGAHAAAQAGVDAFTGAPHLTPPDVLQRLHGALRSTRGAVAAVAELDLDARELRYAGAGNIAGAVLDAEHRRGLLSHSGTLGQAVRRAMPVTLPWSADAALVVHSDGLSSSWNLDVWPGLRRRRAAVIAGVLTREYRRAHDDVTVVVVKETA
ncbi:anti-sigma regulatory factor (Ser/Thr protein kinase) [Deinococcus metalli]|uniref:Anti-sigma regulatory factor (Ser/Thr protein kinase) n=1 Tax=Deinococcus metalli TaxID=1141878 RepID=A0A7W8KH20_9DEIO|nr:ATP-binding SpoIIE family protein phosphatase [Deinococcus metalli]MBB5376394.1 anti-sigma regulatory factor (Ser/Thr protein kinase) [Deinococcus metalli]GHF44391.1 TorS-related protein [Deinococcus metalli]